MKNTIISLFVLMAFIIVGCTGGKRTGGNAVPVTSPEEDVYASTPVMESSSALPEHPVVNVYLENSGSMNGYVDGGRTMFQQDVYNYLTDINISELPAEMNLFFINSQIIPQNGVISNFINNLNPNSFNVSGGSTATTDMAEIFRMILDRTANDTLSIFISDCIFSPGNVQSPEAYLTNQQIGIKESIARYTATHPNFGVMVYQLYSNFKGRYYDYKNRPHQYTGERPYYIWVMGNAAYLALLRDLIPNNKFRGNGVSNFWFASSIQFKDVDYSVLLNPRKGYFDKKSKSDLTNMKADKNGDFMFTIATDLKLMELLLGDDYLMDTDNYARLIEKKLSDELYIEIKRNEKSMMKATHNISLTSKGKIPKGEINVILQCLTPQWAYSMNDDDDAILSEANKMKTYGLKYLLDGVQQGITARNSGYYMNMIVNLK